MVAAYNDVIEVPCKRCGVLYTILADREDVASWIMGTGYIQNVLAYLSASERELLLSGTCDNCWNQMFPKVDNDEE